MTLILLATAASKLYLYIDVNHIIFDGNSLQIFCRDIDRAYRSEPIEEEDWTLAQMAAEEKNAISHRGRAIAKLVEFLKNN